MVAWVTMSVQHEATQVPMQVSVPARVDVWLIVLLTLAVAGLVALTLPLLRMDDVPLWTKVLLPTLALGTVLVSLVVTVPVRYLLEPEGLTVRSGFLTLRLAYRDLIRVDRVIGLLAAPAWSLVRLRVALAAGGAIEVAPRDREALLAELGRRAPQLQPGGRGLIDPKRVPGPRASGRASKRGRG